MKKIDFLIVGQGLAGTILSYHLLKMNRSVLIIDKATEHSSSKVAAGIYNPITGVRLVKTWNAEGIFTYLESFYKELELELNTKFLHPMDIYRPFNSIEDQNEGLSRSASEENKPFIKSSTTSATLPALINDPFGGLTFKKSGYVDLSCMLNAYRQFLDENDLLIDGVFDENELSIHEDYVIYNKVLAQKVIYCDGAYGKESKYFGWLPYNLVKGEILKLKIEGNFKSIISKGIYLLPTDEGFYRVGATYNWNDLSKSPTKEGKIELLQKIDALLKCPYEVVGHSAGIRPATKDRRPFIGLHPEIKTLAIFNGLGTKGVSLAPFYARQFSEYLVQGKELDKDVNLNRFISLYYIKDN